MIQVADVIDIMEEIAPPALAEPWDNVGLMFGDDSWPVEHVVLALDPTPAVIVQAEALWKALVVTHHPLFFEPIRTLMQGSPAFRVVMLMAKANVALYAAHTNLDKSPTHGTARALAGALGFESPVLCGPGCLVTLPERVRAGELAQHVAGRLAARAVALIGIAETTPVQRVGLIPGSGGDEVSAARDAGAEIVITGELKHHQALEALEGTPAITAGHFETERPVLGLVQRHLQDRCPGLHVRIAEESSPIRSIHTQDCGG